MNHGKTLPLTAICAALASSLFFAILIRSLNKYITLEQSSLLLFLLLTTLTMLAFNWQTLSKPTGKTFSAWLLAAGSLLVTTGIWALNLFSDSDFPIGITKQQNNYVFFFLFNAVLVSAFLLSLRNVSTTARGRDENFNYNNQHFLFNSLVYGGFLFIAAVILALGFALLNLIGFNLWEMLGKLGQSLVMGFTIGGTLLFLNVIPVFASERRPPAFLFIFPGIILLFIAIYLLALPFTDLVTIKIDSAVRLSTAGVLWLFLIYLNDPQRRPFNLIASLAGLILTLLSLRGMLIRIDVYGLTLDRIYAQIVVIILLVGHGFIFLKALTAKRFPAFSERCLTLMMIVFLLIFTLTAFLPAMRWSLNSQITRYTTGGGDLSLLRKYDFSPFGAEGKKALDAVREFHHDNPAAIAKIDALDKSWEVRQKEKEEVFFQALNRQPETLVLPVPVRKELTSYTYSKAKDSIVFAADANHDGQEEIIALLSVRDKENDADYKLLIFLQPNEPKGKILELDYPSIPPAKLLENIKQGKWQYQKPEFDDLKIEGLPVIHFPAS